MKAKIVHSRKGTFIGETDRAKFEDPDREWIEVTILEGRAKELTAAGSGPGDTINLRKSFCTITEIPDDD